uniref:Uncharacterized protein n=1 Tax=Cacopsylla melanoneura TaxID=428564 RepID=A0A8D8ZEC9_9HEMI
MHKKSKRAHDDVAGFARRQLPQETGLNFTPFEFECVVLLLVIIRVYTGRCRFDVITIEKYYQPIERRINTPFHVGVILLNCRVIGCLMKRRVTCCIVASRR